MSLNKILAIVLSILLFVGLFFEGLLFWEIAETDKQNKSAVEHTVEEKNGK